MSPLNRWKVTNAALKPKYLISSRVNSKWRLLISACFVSIHHLKSERFSEQLPQPPALHSGYYPSPLDTRRLLTDSTVWGEELITDLLKSWGRVYNVVEKTWGGKNEGLSPLQDFGHVSNASASASNHPEPLWKPQEREMLNQSYR